MAPRKTILEGGQLLFPDGRVAPGDLVFSPDGIVAAAPPGGATASGAVRRIAAADYLVLPGIVDIHGDAFERQMMPRPGVAVPHEIAFLDTDRQLVANGITTAFHGVTYSWEPGLRSREAGRAVRDVLARLDGRLGCEARLHLRFEAFALDGVDEVEAWIDAGDVDLLAFNDHTPDIHRKLGDTAAVLKYVERTGLSPDAFRRLVEDVFARRDEVPAALSRLAGAALRAGTPMLSHDDDSPEVRHRFHALGAGIAEFPKTAATAETARALGNPVVMGAPNVMRGGSHIKSVSAGAMVQAGLCTVLASDYYYPALLHAVFRLVAEKVANLPEAWALVSRNPALAAGLEDRGEFAPGRRADVVVVDARDPGRPRVAATYVAGRPVFAAAAPFAA